VLLGGVAGNTNRQLGFHGLEVTASDFIAILRTLTVMGKTSFPGTRLTCLYGLEWLGVTFFLPCQNAQSGSGFCTDISFSLRHSDFVLR
jgi:hypothetical protein